MPCPEEKLCLCDGITRNEAHTIGGFKGDLRGLIRGKIDVIIP
jgi:hypothetical protein